MMSLERMKEIRMYAEAVTPEIINFMASKGKGLICLPMSKRLCDKFDLQMMTTKIESLTRQLLQYL